MLSRTAVAGLLIAYTRGGSAQSVGAAAPAGDAHSFVLSSSAFASHFSLAENAHLVMEFIEELFAVRIPKLIAFLVIFSFACVLALIIPLLFDEILYRFQTPKHYRALFRYVLQIAIVIVGLWLALAAVGIDFLGIVLTFGVVSIAISPGIGAAVSDLTGAISLKANDVVDVGHEISINGLRGTVVQMTFSKVALRAADEPSDVIWIPNAWFGAYPIRQHNGAARVVADATLDPYVVRKVK